MLTYSKYHVNQILNMVNNQFYSAPQVAKLLGLSRVAVFNQIKKGKIKARKIGRNYVIERKDIIGHLTKPLKRL